MTPTRRVAVGQRWRSKDKRDDGRTVVVERVDADEFGNGFVWVRWVRLTRVRVSTLRARYTLVAESFGVQPSREGQ